MVCPITGRKSYGGSWGKSTNGWSLCISWMVSEGEVKELGLSRVFEEIARDPIEGGAPQTGQQKDSRIVLTGKEKDDSNRAA